MTADLWEELKAIGRTMTANRLAQEREEQERREAEAARAAASAPRLIARYPTTGGATVEVAERAGFYNYDGMTETHASCSACPATHTIEWGWSAWNADFGVPQEGFDEGGKRSTPAVRAWAQQHAKECWATPLRGAAR